ncbi:MAG: hypothetical protein MK105_10970 [Crocinitomicaceae bacterium]|nr:hypothetical protein [Crocinitomicaceae bacterium]
MKLISIVLMSICCSFVSFSQELDSRLLERYSSLELAELAKDNPAEYKFLVHALDNAIYIIDLPKGKEVELESIEIKGKELNFIDLGLSIEDRTQHFKVIGEDKLLVVKSRHLLNLNLNK